MTNDFATFIILHNLNLLSTIYLSTTYFKKERKREREAGRQAGRQAGVLRIHNIHIKYIDYTYNRERDRKYVCVCLFVCLSVCLSVCHYVSLSI